MSSPLLHYASAGSGRVAVLAAAFPVIAAAQELLLLLSEGAIVVVLRGTFALYSFAGMQHSVFCQTKTADEELSIYYHLGVDRAVVFSPFKMFLVLLLFVLFGACMVIGGGVLTPTISVLSAIYGLQDPATSGLADAIAAT